VGCVCVLASIFEGVAVAILHPAFGSFFDSRLGYFTFIDIASFGVFQAAFSIGNKGGWRLQCSLYGAIILSAPGAFYMFNLFMWNEFAAADGIYFPFMSLGLLIWNVLIYSRVL
jgi:hypothetical protein